MYACEYSSILKESIYRGLPSTFQAASSTAKDAPVMFALIQVERRHLRSRPCFLQCMRLVELCVSIGEFIVAFQRQRDIPYCCPAIPRAVKPVPNMQQSVPVLEYGITNHNPFRSLIFNLDKFRLLHDSRSFTKN